MLPPAINASRNASPLLGCCRSLVLHSKQTSRRVRLCLPPALAHWPGWTPLCCRCSAAWPPHPCPGSTMGGVARLGWTAAGTGLHTRANGRAGRLQTIHWDVSSAAVAQHEHPAPLIGQCWQNRPPHASGTGPRHRGCWCTPPALIVLMRRTLMAPQPRGPLRFYGQE